MRKFLVEIRYFFFILHNMKQTFNFSFINLWCTKNLVDSQMLMGRILSLWVNNTNYTVQYINDPFDKKTNIVFLNSCGFISSARDEMMDILRQLQKAKKQIYLIWCWLQYYKTMMPTSMERMKFKEFTNLHFLSWNDFESVTLRQLIIWYDSKTFGDFEFANTPRAYTNAHLGFEYLKISEGCDNHCTFCIIPRIRGKQVSLSIEKILSEIETMVHMGIQEIILIAQDTATYGMDLYRRKPMLVELLKKIDQIPGDFTYRLLYLYPDVLTKDQLKEMTKLQKLIPYFDIPLQHISPTVLKRMGRFYHTRSINNILSTIKKEFPLSYIRTNIMVGFPGETKEDFNQLKDYIKHSDFDHVALFEYHDEPFAASSKLHDKIDDKEIRKRFLDLKKIVDTLLLKKEKKRKGKKETGYIMDILKKWKTEKLLVRPLLHAPEIDGYDEIGLKQVTGVFNEKNELEIGDKIVYTV